MPQVQIQPDKAQPSEGIAKAFYNIQRLVRACKDPSLNADERDVLQGNLQAIADELNRAAKLDKELSQLNHEVRNIRQELQLLKDEGWQEDEGGP